MSQENKQRASKPAYPYRKSCMGYAVLEQKMVNIFIYNIFSHLVLYIISLKINRSL